MTRLLRTYVLFTVCCMLAGCYDEPWQRGVIDGYVPIYSTDPALKQVSFQPPRKTINGGKLFTAGTNVLQEELDSGLHVISYQDPAHPVKTGFLRIPGFQVAAIDGDYLYANNYNDLIVIPLKALSANMTVGRVSGVWKQLDYPTGPHINYFECVDPSKGIVIGWRRARINDPKCRRTLQPDYTADENNRNNAGLVALNGKLYLINKESLAVYSLSSPEQPVIVKTEGISGIRVDSLFLLNSNELAVLYDSGLERCDTASLDRISHYSNLSYCLKMTAKSDTAYAIASQKTFCGGSSPYLIKYRLRKDTTEAVELNRLQVGRSNAFVIADNYIYIAAEEGMVMVNIAGTTMERVGDVSDVPYTDIINSGSLLFITGREEIICYNIAASHVSPTLISKLPY